MKLFQKINSTVLFLTICHFIITLITDSIAFNNVNYYSTPKYIILKPIVFIALYLFWNFIYQSVTGIKHKDKKHTRRLIFFCIYFGISLLILLLVWPGRWVWDEYYTYQLATDLEYLHWQHYLTSVYYILDLMIIPFGGGIIIIQLIAISLIVSYIVTDLSYRTRYYYFIFIILLFPSVIIQNLYPMRAALYSYILLYALYYIYHGLRNKTNIKLSHFLPLFFSIPIITTWRTEGIIILPTILIMLFFILKKKKITLINQLKYFSIILILSYALNHPQQKWSKENKEYSITAFLNPLSMLLQYENLNKFNELKGDLSSLINLDVLKNNSDFKETPAFWSNRNELIISNESSDYNRFKSAYIKLIIFNPVKFFNVRLKTFLATTSTTHGVGRSSSAYIIENSSHPSIQNFSKHNFLNKSFNPYLRIDTLRVLEGNNSRTPEAGTLVLFLFWNLNIMYIFLIIVTLVSVIKKDLFFFLICCTLWTLSFGLFCTAPASYFMYYFPVYLTTYVFTFSYLVDINKTNGDKK